MSIFGALDISGSGVQAMQTWIDANAGNIANAGDVSATNAAPYEAEIANFSPAPAGPGAPGGVAVSVTTSTAAGIVEQEPGNPLADQAGNVQLPSISLGDQLVGLIQAQEGYSADTSAITRAISAYQAGIAIGS